MKTINIKYILKKEIENICKNVTICDLREFKRLKIKKTVLTRKIIFQICFFLKQTDKI